MRLVIHHNDMDSRDGTIQETMDGDVIAPGTPVHVNPPRQGLTDYTLDVEGVTYRAKRDPSTTDDMTVRIYYVTSPAEAR